jgi:hypothetical protein
MGSAKVSLGVLTSRDSPVRVPRNTGRRPGVRAGSYVRTATAAMRAAAAISCYCGRRTQRKRDQNRRKATHPLPLAPRK